MCLVWEKIDVVFNQYEEKECVSQIHGDQPRHGPYHNENPWLPSFLPSQSQHEL